MGGKSGRIADVVKMIMRLDYGGGVVASDIQTSNFGVDFMMEKYVNFKNAPVSVATVSGLVRALSLSFGILDR